MDRDTLPGGLARTLYTEALLLGDEMRAYFDHAARDERESLAPLARLHFACESLKATTRLMHVIAWLANRQALDSGDLAEHDANPAENRLAEASPSEPAVLGQLPSPARKLILAGIDLYGQVGRLAEGVETPTLSPARALFRRLEATF